MYKDSLSNTAECFEFKSADLTEFCTSKQSVQGHIAANKQWWFDHLQLPAFVSGVLNNGYRLPFVALPPDSFIKNNQSALSKPEFVSSAIEQLLHDRCILEVTAPSYCCNPLSVVSGRKLRLVLDLSRSVNPFIQRFKFKYEGLPTLSVMFRENFWFFTFDLESGYHHLDINEKFWEYLGFSWSFEGVPRYFVFRVLPFGLSSACYLFTRMLRPFVARWRSLGVFSIMYIDDGICGCRNLDDAKSASLLVQSDLHQSGWKVNEKKSNWEPHQIGEWLGIAIDTIRMFFVIPEKKVLKLKSLVTVLLNDYPNLRVRDVASVSGFVISLGMALGPITKLLTRQMYSFIHIRESWDDILPANEGVLQELRFWASHIEAFNGYPINRPLSSIATLICDASESGFGAHVTFCNEKKCSSSLESGTKVTFCNPSHVDVTLCNNRKFCSGMWSESERSKSSTYRELKAVFLALKSFSSFLTGGKVKVFSDNQNVVRIVHCGSSVNELQKIALDIFSFCLTNSISFQAQWIPRAENQLADYLSRIVDPDDWMLSPDLFQILAKKWGPFDVDRMACHYNCQLPRFNSKFWCPGTEAVDCFTQDWVECNNFVCLT